MYVEVLYVGMTGVSGGGGPRLGASWKKKKVHQRLGRLRDGTARYAFWGGVCEELSTYEVLPPPVKQIFPVVAKSLYLRVSRSREGFALWSSMYSRGRKDPLFRYTFESFNAVI